MARIDLNADVGEGMAGDAALLAHVTSANVACGGHAGDDDTIRATIAAARHRGVVVGAHPGWPDREHMGRRALELPDQDVHALLRRQIGRVQAIADSLHWPVRYVKLHGALANQAAVDPRLAAVVARALATTGLGWLVMPHTAMVAAARAFSIHHALEGFADRAYTDAGHLAPRQEAGAVLHDPLAIARRAVAMLDQQALPLASGGLLPTSLDSLCVHGDTPGALTIVTAVTEALRAAGHVIAPLPW